MTTRKWTESDIGAIQRLHDAMHVGYPFPHFSPLFGVRRLVEHEGEVAAAGAVKLIGEAFLWIDPNLSLRKKVELIGLISAECTRDAFELGLDELSAWVPPPIEEGFSHALTNLGWVRSPWHSWSRNLCEYTRG